MECSVLFVPPPASVFIVVLDQAGWYTLSVVTRISEPLQVGPCLECALLLEYRTNPPSGPMSRIEDHTRLGGGRPNMEEASQFGEMNMEASSTVVISSPPPSSGFGWDLNRSNGDCWDLNWIKM